jgi:hypothetical protein
VQTGKIWVLGLEPNHSEVWRVRKEFKVKINIGKFTDEKR